MYPTLLLVFLSLVFAGVLGLCAIVLYRQERISGVVKGRRDPNFTIADSFAPTPELMIVNRDMTSDDENRQISDETTD